MILSIVTRDLKNKNFRIYPISILLLGLLTFSNGIDISVLMVSNGIDDTIGRIVLNNDNWKSFWKLLFIGGIFNCLISWYLFSTFFSLRIKWSNGKNISSNNPKILFSYLSLIRSLPNLLLLIFISIFFSKYSAYFENYIYIVFFPSFFLILHLITSYVCITNIYMTCKLKSIWWFIILPILFYIWLLISLLYISGEL